jgi:hypothetical protein
LLVKEFGVCDRLVKEYFVQAIGLFNGYSVVSGGQA